jgi:hypothetical protein
MALLLTSPPGWGDGLPPGVIVVGLVSGLLFVAAVETAVIIAEARAYRALLGLDRRQAWRTSIVANLASAVIVTLLLAVITTVISEVSTRYWDWEWYPTIAWIGAAILTVAIEAPIVLRIARAYPDRRRLFRVAVGVNVVSCAAIALLGGTQGTVAGPVVLLVDVVAVLAVLVAGCHALFTRIGARQLSSTSTPGTASQRRAETRATPPSQAPGSMSPGVPRARDG